MAPAGSTSPRPRITGIQWVICVVAAIGFAFDIYALLVLPLIVRPAVMALGGLKPGTPAFAKLSTTGLACCSYIPAVAGGIFGLLGGYLTDLFGRRRILVWSILLYAFSALAAGYATSLPMLLFLRCTTFIGVSVEFVAAVAWLAELFPDPKQRESGAGLHAGLLVARRDDGQRRRITWPSPINTRCFPIFGGHEPWRYTLHLRCNPRDSADHHPAIPARIAHVAGEEGQPARCSGRASARLFQPQFRRTTLVTTLMYACSYGAAFGAIQHLPRIVPGLPEVMHLSVPKQQQIVSSVQGFQETRRIGWTRAPWRCWRFRSSAAANCCAFSRSPACSSCRWYFSCQRRTTWRCSSGGVALAGFFTVAQFSFWGNYLPRVYPTHLRGTGESFAANIGGRMLGTSAALLTTQLANRVPGGSPASQLANAAAFVALGVYLCGFIASFALPDPQMQKLPD